MYLKGLDEGVRFRYLRIRNHSHDRNSNRTRLVRRNPMRMTKLLFGVVVVFVFVIFN